MSAYAIQMPLTTHVDSTHQQEHTVRIRPRYTTSAAENPMWAYMRIWLVIMDWLLWPSGTGDQGPGEGGGQAYSTIIDFRLGMNRESLLHTVQWVLYCSKRELVFIPRSCELIRGAKGLQNQLTLKHIRHCNDTTPTATCKKLYRTNNRTENTVRLASWRIGCESWLDSEEDLGCNDKVFGLGYV
jgi:hypothetical protein